MMPGLRSRRRAEEFNALVEQLSTQGAESRADERFADDLDLVARIRSIEPVDPRPKFVSDLRAELMAEAATVLTPTAAKLTVRPRRTTRERRVAAVVGGFAVVSASASMAAASQGALPGETLYPLKRAIENASTQLRTDESQRAEALLTQASARLTEVRALVEKGDADGHAIASTLYTFADQGRAAADLILDDHQQQGDQREVERLSAFADASRHALADLQTAVPESARPALIEASQVVEQIDRQALYACAGCGAEVAPMAATTELLSGPAETVTAPEPAKKQQKRDRPKLETSTDSDPKAGNEGGDGDEAGPVEDVTPPPTEPPTTEAEQEAEKVTKKSTNSLRQLTESVTGAGDGDSGLIDDTVDGLGDTTDDLLGQ